MAKVADAEIKVKATGISQFKAEMNRAKQSITSFGKSLTSFTAIGTAGVVLLAREVARAIKASIDLGVRFEGIHRGFVNIIGYQNREFLASMKEASRGTLSELELMENANKAIVLGIKQEYIPQLVEAATQLGAAMGRTSTEAFSDLALGIGRQSRLILDNLGIIVHAEEAYKKYAEAVGKSASELTGAEKSIAFQRAAFEAIEKALKGTGDALGEQEAAIGRAEAKWKEFLEGQGQNAVDFFGNLLLIIEQVNEALSPKEKQVQTVGGVPIDIETVTPGTQGTIRGVPTFIPGEERKAEMTRGFRGLGPSQEMLEMWDAALEDMAQGIITKRQEVTEKEIESLGRIENEFGETNAEARARARRGEDIIIASEVE